MNATGRLARVLRQRMIASGLLVALLGRGIPFEMAHCSEEASSQICQPEHGKLNTADASPVDKGKVETELTVSSSRARHTWDTSGDSKPSGEADENAMTLAVTIGLGRDCDLQLASSYRWMKDQNNDFDSDGEPGPEAGRHLGDMDLAFRHRFYSGHNLDIAWLGGFTAPSGSSSTEREIGTSQEYWSLNQTLAASMDFGRWTFNADGGYTLPFGGKRGQARGTMNTDIALGCQVTSWLQPEMELNYSREFISQADSSRFLAATLGLVMPFSERWRVNTGHQIPLSGRNTEQNHSWLIAIKYAF